jgi:predicted NBD/HSP70 family sugar kinase
LAIAVDVGVRHLAVAVGDLARRVLAERWVSLERGHRPRDGMEILLRCIDETIAEVDADREHVVGAAISIAAPIAPVSGRLLVPGVLPGWNSRDLADAVGRRWQVPVTVDNDANLGALAESIWGECPGSPSLLYVKAASRVGLGIALNGSVYRGNDGCAGELGHLPMRPGGATCWCGRRGCLELYAGADGMLRRLAAGTGNAPTDVAALTARALAGDPEVTAVVRSSARMLARGMATLALLFNPTAIVIGGELACLGELLLTPARSELATLSFAPEVTVLQSSLGDRASLLGALALVLAETERFTDRSSAST